MWSPKYSCAYHNQQCKISLANRPSVSRWATSPPALFKQNNISSEFIFLIAHKKDINQGSQASEVIISDIFEAAGTEKNKQMILKQVIFRRIFKFKCKLIFCTAFSISCLFILVKDVNEQCLICNPNTHFACFRWDIN